MTSVPGTSNSAARTARPAAPAEVSAGAGRVEVVLQRIVLPWGVELPGLVADVLPLYLNRTGVLRVGQHPDRHDWKRDGAYPHPDQPLEDHRSIEPPDARMIGRTSFVLPPLGRVSTDTYFNRVHAGYLARWTTPTEVTLQLRGVGRVQVVVRRCTREGRPAIHRVAVVDLDPREAFTTSVPVALFRGGGALWFDLQALDGEVEVSAAQWVAHVEQPGPPSVVDVGVCTYNRPHDVLTLLRTLGADEEFRGHLGTIWVVDNGTQSFTDLPEAPAAMAEWGPRLKVVSQPNLGGSGGFSRAMHESVAHGAARYLIVSDDDALPEPESLRRAVVFADVATTPVAVGGQMLLRAQPMELHSSGEWINEGIFRWGLAPLGQEEVQVDRVALDRVVDVGYNGWWLCLIPTAAIREVGLGQPFFIKWDDAEFGYRLRAAGVPTVTLPGVATWHESWELKDDTTDWTLYFHIRNRLMVAAMLSDGLAPAVAQRRLRAVAAEVARQDVLRNVGRRAYSSADAANQALEDFLAGPGILERPLDEVVAQVRANRSRFPGDEQVDAFTAEARAPGDPVPRSKRSLAFVRALAAEFGVSMPSPRRGPTVQAGAPQASVAGDPPSTSDDWDLWGGPVERGPVLLPKSADFWWGLAEHPDAAVVSVDGATANLRRREPGAARAVVRRFAGLARRLETEGPGLVTAYGRARRTLSTPQAWEKQWTR